MTNPIPSTLVAATVLLATATAAAQDRAIIVLDASGSMWGQIDGRPKLEIARETLREVLATVPPEIELGLMAYGHRERGNCADIELLVPPARGSAAAIAETADRLRFQGRTPLSAAVEQAAQSLRYTEDKATVILITDGIETCNADPCALGAALEEAGIDFTAHVIGFGLSAEEGRQVACLAETTGGEYISADNAEALGEALSRTVAAEPAAPAEPAPPAEPEIVATLDAPDEAAMGSPVVVGWDGPGGRLDEIQIFDPDARGGDGEVVRRQPLRSDRGYEEQVATLILPSGPGSYVLRYFDREAREVLAERPIEVVQVKVALSAPDEVDMGSRVTVGWAGPGANQDEIQIFDPDARGSDGEVVRRQPLRGDRGFEDRTATLVAPAEPGSYILRYFSRRDREVLAERPIEVVQVKVALSAPDEVGMATEITVRWAGPGADQDEIQIVDPGSGGDGEVVRRQPLRSDGGYDDGTATLVAPATPGSYVLRYFSRRDREVLAERAIVVAEVEVAIDAPKSVPADTTVTIPWIGPGDSQDEIQFFDVDARQGNGEVVRRQPVRGRGFDEREVTIRTPERPGRYELRYFNRRDRTVLTSRSIVVE